MTIFCGVDGGLNGAICYIEGDSVRFDAIPTQTITRDGKKKKRFDVQFLDGLFAILRDCDVYMVIEKAQALRKPVFAKDWGTGKQIMIDSGAKQGTAATFQTGYGYGLLCAFAMAYNINHITVGCQAWQQKLYSKIRSGGTKMTSLETAKHLYPHVEIKNHNYSDALLIATYAKLTYQSQKGLSLYGR
jgi:hypothetical protein